MSGIQPFLTDGYLRWSLMFGPPLLPVSLMAIYDDAGQEIAVDRQSIAFGPAAWDDELQTIAAASTSSLIWTFPCAQRADPAYMERLHAHFEDQQQRLPPPWQSAVAPPHANPPVHAREEAADTDVRQVARTDRGDRAMKMNPPRIATTDTRRLH